MKAASYALIGVQPTNQGSSHGTRVLDLDFIFFLIPVVLCREDEICRDRARCEAPPKPKLEVSIYMWPQVAHLYSPAAAEAKSE